MYHFLQKVCLQKMHLGWKSVERAEELVSGQMPLIVLSFVTEDLPAKVLTARPSASPGPVVILWSWKKPYSDQVCNVHICVVFYQISFILT